MPHGRYRLKGFDYRANRWYFVTAVTQGRKRLFGAIEGVEFQPSPLGQIVEDELAALVVRRPRVQIPASVVMPNHVHLLVGLANEGRFEDIGLFGKVPADSLATVVGGWKSGITRRANVEIPGDGSEIWQRRFHDRIVRNSSEWEAVAGYILWNPVTWHLDPLSGNREPTDEEIREWKDRHGL